MMKIVGEAADVDSALRLVRETQPEVVFLDVPLAGETGFDFVARLSDPAPAIVFVTAHDRYAVRGFDCNALDYLLKPVHPKRLAETIERLGCPVLRRSDRGPAQEGDLVYLKGPSLARFVPWREIEHIVSEGNYTRVRMDDGTSALVLRTLKDWLLVRPPALFLRIHRTALIRRTALREIRAFDSTRQVILTSGVELPVSRVYWPDLKKLLK